MTCSKLFNFCRSTAASASPTGSPQLSYRSMDISCSSLDPDLNCRKNPSSYPDFSTRPFCTTTLTLPLKCRAFNRCSIAADNTSAARTFRRNSTKFFSSLQLSMGDNPGKEVGLYDDAIV